MNDMNQSSLQTFIAIIETGSLVKASERLNVTQSTVTMRLKSLEEEVGQKLVVRQKSGVSLTAAGTKLLSYAHVIDGLWGQALRATSLPQGLSAIYHIGCSALLWPLGGKVFFEAMSSYEAGFALSVQQADEAHLLQGLNDGTIDMAFVCEPVIRKSQTSIRLADSELALYSDREQTPLKFDHKYIYVDYGTEFRRQHDEYYFDAGAATIGFNMPQMAAEHILEHGGSAYLPRALAHPLCNKGRLYEMREAPCFSIERYLVLKESQDDDFQWLYDLLDRLQLLRR